MLKGHKMFRFLSIITSILVLIGDSDRSETLIAEAKRRGTPMELAPVIYDVLKDSNQLTRIMEAENEVNIIPKAAGEEIGRSFCY